MKTITYFQGKETECEMEEPFSANRTCCTPLPLGMLCEEPSLASVPNLVDAWPNRIAVTHSNGRPLNRQAPVIRLDRLTCADAHVIDQGRITTGSIMR
jgi:hypothetical protein